VAALRKVRRGELAARFRESRICALPLTVYLKVFVHNLQQIGASSSAMLRRSGTFQSYDPNPLNTTRARFRCGDGRAGDASVPAQIAFRSEDTGEVMTLRRAAFFAGVCVMAGLAMVWPHARALKVQVSPRRAAGPTDGHDDAMTPDSAAGMAVKASISPDTPRPFYNRPKSSSSRQAVTATRSPNTTRVVLRVGKHFDFTWFEMQHSTMSWDEVAKMIAACPRVGAAP